MSKISKETWNIQDAHFGPFLPLIQDERITDINFNGYDTWVDHLDKGRYKVDIEVTKGFVDQFATRISNVVSGNFNKFDNLLEAETDELRISFIHDSVASTGTSISIRKTPAVRRLNKKKILEDHYCSEEVLYFLINCMYARLNTLMCGLPGAGKTEFLKFLTQYIPLSDKVITIEDNLEIHYRDINPGSNCVELKVDEENFSYTKAIKACLRQNPQWVLLSEARSTEVKYLMECFSTGLHGLTTLHTDDVRKIPDRILNMMQDSYAASRLENDVYTFVDTGILIRKKIAGDGSFYRYIDQIGFFDRDNDTNTKTLIVDGGKVVNRELPKNILKKFSLVDISDPFSIPKEIA